MNVDFLKDLGTNILILPQIETPRGIATIESWDCSNRVFWNWIWVS